MDAGAVERCTKGRSVGFAPFGPVWRIEMIAGPVALEGVIADGLIGYRMVEFAGALYSAERQSDGHVT